LFYCEVLPMAYLVDQQTIMFYKMLQSSENIVLRVLGRLKHDANVACFSKYAYAAQYLTLNKRFGWTL